MAALYHGLLHGATAVNPALSFSHSLVPPPPACELNDLFLVVRDGASYRLQLTDSELLPAFELTFNGSLFYNGEYADTFRQDSLVLANVLCPSQEDMVRCPTMYFGAAASPKAKQESNMTTTRTPHRAPVDEPRCFLPETYQEVLDTLIVVDADRLASGGVVYDFTADKGAWKPAHDCDCGCDCNCRVMTAGARNAQARH